MPCPSGITIYPNWGLLWDYIIPELVPVVSQREQTDLSSCHIVASHHIHDLLPGFNLIDYAPIRIRSKYKSKIRHLSHIATSNPFPWHLDEVRTPYPYSIGSLCSQHDMAVMKDEERAPRYSKERLNLRRS